MATTAANGLKIGEVAKRTGIAVGALRYYESLGLLQSVRGDNGYRYYPLDAIQKVLFIKKAQVLGFSLEDIGSILNIHHQGDYPCELVQALLQEKIEQMEVQIQQMIAFKTELENYRDRWAQQTIQDDRMLICPLIETFLH